MLHSMKPGRFAFMYSSAYARTTITPGNGSKGSYVNVATSGNLSQDVYMVRLWVTDGWTSATIRDIIMDIGTDPAGGTSYSQTYGITNIWVPQASDVPNGGYWQDFPLYIKAGSSVAIRAQANSTATVKARIWFFGQPENPAALSSAQYVETLGVSGNGGTPVTPGINAAWGSWTSMGTTTRATWGWLLAAGFNVGTTDSYYVHSFELAWSSDATNYWTITNNNWHNSPTTFEMASQVRYFSFANVPSGVTLYGRASSAGPGYYTSEVVAYGFGG